jgi:hypothetical protein
MIIGLLIKASPAKMLPCFKFVHHKFYRIDGKLQDTLSTKYLHVSLLYWNFIWQVENLFGTLNQRDDKIKIHEIKLPFQDESTSKDVVS